MTSVQCLNFYGNAGAAFFVFALEIKHWGDRCANIWLRGQIIKRHVRATMDHDGPNIIFSSGGLVDLSVAKKSDFLLTFHNFQQKIFLCQKLLLLILAEKGRWANSHSHSRQSAFIGVTIVIIIPKQPDTRAHVSKYTVAIIIIDKHNHQHHRHHFQTDTDMPPFVLILLTVYGDNTK